MTDPIILVNYQADTFRGELHYHSDGEPSYTYLKFDEGDGHRINRPVSLEDWALAPAQQLTHDCFNWHHYVVDKYILEKINERNLSDVEFNRFLELISLEFEQEHRRACTFKVRGIAFESVLSQLKAFSAGHPTLLLDVRDQKSPFMGDCAAIFMTREPSLSSSHLSDVEWEALIQLMSVVNPYLGESLALNLLDIKPLSLIDTTYSHYRPGDKLVFQHIHQGYHTMQAYHPRPIMMTLQSETIAFLSRLFEGYPLGVRD